MGAAVEEGYHGDQEADHQEADHQEEDHLEVPQHQHQHQYQQQRLQWLPQEEMVHCMEQHQPCSQETKR